MRPAAISGVGAARQDLAGRERPRLLPKRGVAGQLSRLEANEQELRRHGGLRQPFGQHGRPGGAPASGGGFGHRRPVRRPPVAGVSRENVHAGRRPHGRAGHRDPLSRALAGTLRRRSGRSRAKSPLERRPVRSRRRDATRVFISAAGRTPLDHAPLSGVGLRRSRRHVDVRRGAAAARGVAGTGRVGNACRRGAARPGLSRRRTRTSAPPSFGCATT